MKELPFAYKRRFSQAHGMQISDVKVIFKNPWSLEIFEQIVKILQIDPNIIF